MMTLNDGRSELWQWDTGRTLAVDADCSQVHFSNKVFGRSIDVDVVGGKAIIPDVLLQTDKDLNVWAFVGTAENGYTKISKTFKVNRRNKPADYVFTPVDQTTIAEIAAIAQSVRDDADNGLFDGAQGPAGSQGETGPQGPSGPAGSDGKDGAPGKDGKTPEYGVDYGTPEQITEIAQNAAERLRPEVDKIKDDLDNIRTATDNDVGKVLMAKTVTDGKVTEWEFGDAAETRLEEFEELIDTTLTEDAEFIASFENRYKKLAGYIIQGKNIYTSPMYIAPHIVDIYGKPEKSNAITSKLRTYVKPTSSYSNVLFSYEISNKIVQGLYAVTNSGISLAPTPAQSNILLAMEKQVKGYDLSKGFSGFACQVRAGDRIIVYGVRA